MIIYLKNANFASSNIGTLDSWRVSYSLSGGISKVDGECPGSVKKGSMLTAKFTLADGAELTSATVTSGTAGAVSTSTSGTTVTVTIPNVQSAITLSVVATGTANPPSGGTTYTITYEYKDTSGNILQASTTESVPAGTNMTFSASNAPAIDGYTVSSVSPTSATIDKNITVTYTYTANAVSGTGKNLFNVNDPDYLPEYRLSPSTGKPATDQDVGNWFTSGYIAVTPGTNYVASGELKSNGNRGNCTAGSRWYFFDSSKTFLGKDTGGYYFNDGATYRTAPDGAAYVRVSISKSIYINPQLEIGTEHTSYEEYKG